MPAVIWVTITSIGPNQSNTAMTSQGTSPVHGSRNHLQEAKKWGRDSHQMPAANEAGGTSWTVSDLDWPPPFLLYIPFKITLCECLSKCCFMSFNYILALKVWCLLWSMIFSALGGTRDPSLSPWQTPHSCHSHLQYFACSIQQSSWPGPANLFLCRGAKKEPS